MHVFPLRSENGEDPYWALMPGEAAKDNAHADELERKAREELFSECNDRVRLEVVIGDPAYVICDLANS